MKSTMAGHSTVLVTAAQAMSTGKQPAAPPPQTMFWAVRRLRIMV